MKRIILVMTLAIAMLVSTSCATTRLPDVDYKVTCKCLYKSQVGMYRYTLIGDSQRINFYTNDVYELGDTVRIGK